MQKNYLYIKFEISGNNVVDYHGSDFFDEEWFDIVFCLRAEIETLNKRYIERGYCEIKIKNNIESEIFQVSYCLSSRFRFN